VVGTRNQLLLSFPGEPRLAGFIGAKDEVVVTTGAIRHAKLQSNRNHQHPTFYRPDALPVTQPTKVRALKGKKPDSTVYNALVPTLLITANSGNEILLLAVIRRVGIKSLYDVYLCLLVP